MLCFPSKKSASLYENEAKRVRYSTLTCVTRINLHSFEALVRLKRCAGPFPNTAKITLPGEFVAVWRDGDGMPVLETDITAIECTVYGQICLGVILRCSIHHALDSVGRAIISISHTIDSVSTFHVSFAPLG